MSRGYGILFSFFNDTNCEISMKLRCLEDVRMELHRKFPDPDYEFDIVKVVSHSEYNSHPEIGVYSKSGNITDSEFRKMEEYVEFRTRNKNPNIEAKNLPSVPELSWELIEKYGSYPDRS